ncbi:hypothetical protein C0995_003227 [Termitomyces sp. Mi166|nr:hypothetical protein C0995_003227 [Termitomyces sp. Mi166\
MPPPTADLQSTWAFLEEGVDHIMTKLHTGVSYSKRTDSLQDEALLRYYADEWDRYTTGANYINRLFTYLNRHWVKRERDEGRRQVYPVYTLALVQWNANLFTPIQRKNSKLTDAVLRMIQSQRNGNSTDQSLVKKVVNSFVSLGLDDSDLNKECLDVYREYFEIPFLKATTAYYRKESKEFLENHSVSDYLKKVEMRLKEEEDRVERYLITSSRKALITKCEETLIRDHKEVLEKHFEQLLEFDKDEDLQRMYALLSRLPNGLKPLHDKFENFVKNAGLSAISTLVDDAEADTDTVEPKTYVNTLVAVYDKSKQTVQRSFRGEVGFMASFDKANQEYVNCNGVTGTSSAKSPELLAKYADLVLRKNNKMAEADDVEAALRSVVTLLQYIIDKDVFQTFYKNRLAKRLVHGVSASEDSETSMIGKLEVVCGADYASRLRAMLSDMKLSKDITDKFKVRMQRVNSDAKIDFTIMVLTHSWDLKPPAHEFMVPREILSTYTDFRHYYQNETHVAHRLIWLWNYSKNELRTNYLNQTYLLLTSTFQTAILLQFNDNDTLSLDELFVATSISKDYLRQILALLVKARILVNEETDQYDLNPSFQSKKIRINLNLPVRSEQKAEVQDAMQTVDTDRKYAMQAAIVRSVH